MLTSLSDTERAILETLVAEAEPLRLVDIARRLRLAPPTIHRQLRTMVDSGLVETVRAPDDPSGRSPAYQARPFLHVVWVDPQQGILEEWATNAPVRWDWPLVSRVPDGPAQRTLHTLLGRLKETDLLGRSPDDLPPKASEAPSVPILIVYGSCARGTARPASDLDLAVLADWDADRVERLRNEVAAVNLVSERNIDVRVFPSAKDTAALPRELANHLMLFGRWVYPHTVEDDVLVRRLGGGA